MSKEARIPKPEAARSRHLFLRASSFFRHSRFGIRHSCCAALIAILLVGGALRLWYTIYLPGHGRDLLHSDMGTNDESAWKMCLGEPVQGQPGFNGYHPLSASTYNYAGYVYFVAAIYAIFGHSPLAVRVIQALVATATVGLVHMLGAAAFGRRAALVAALLSAVYLPLVYYAGFLLTETWFTFLQLAALAVWLRAWGRTASPGEEAPLPAGTQIASGMPTALGGAISGTRTSLVLAGIAGLLAGAATVTRPTFLVATMALSAAAWWFPPSTQPRPRRAALVAAFALCAMLAIAPITMRNYQIHGRFILVSTNGPSTFYVAHVTHSAFIPDLRPGISDVQMADEHRRLVRQYLNRNWPTYLAEIPEFFSEMWTSNDFWPNATTYWRFQPAFDRQPVRSRLVIDEAGGPPFGRVDYFPDLVRYADRLVWLLVGLPFGLLAALFLPLQHRRWLVLYAALVPYLIVPFVAPGFPRYRIPAVPLFFILAAQTATSLGTCRKLLGSRSCTRS